MKPRHVGVVTGQQCGLLPLSQQIRVYVSWTIAYIYPTNVLSDDWIPNEEQDLLMCT